MSKSMQKVIAKYGGNRPIDLMVPASLPYGDADDALRDDAKDYKSTLQWGNGVRPNTLPVEDFEDVEAGNPLRYGPGDQLWEDLKTSILKKGVKDRVYVYVDQKGRAKIAEGNHRVGAVLNLMSEGKVPAKFRIPTVIFYKGNSDLNPKSWIPKSKRRG